MRGVEKWAASDYYRHTTVYKINDQDPLFDTRKLTPHSVIIYMEKNKYIYIRIIICLCIKKSETSCGRRKRNKKKKKHPQDCNSPICMLRCSVVSDS